MKARELFELEPLGDLVRFSDGTPAPPARFKNKLAAWKSRNGEGHFSEKRGGDMPYFTLSRHYETHVVEYVFGLSSTLEFTVDR
jgi:hypothetical protein